LFGLPYPAVPCGHHRLVKPQVKWVGLLPVLPGNRHGSPVHLWPGLVNIWFFFWQCGLCPRFGPMFFGWWVLQRPCLDGVPPFNCLPLSCPMGTMLHYCPMGCERVPVGGFVLVRVSPSIIWVALPCVFFGHHLGLWFLNKFPPEGFWFVVTSWGPPDLTDFTAFSIVTPPGFFAPCIAQKKNAPIPPLL